MRTSIYRVICSTLLLTSLSALQPSYSADTKPVKTDTVKKNPDIVNCRTLGWIWNGMADYNNKSLLEGLGKAGGPGSYAAYTFQGAGVEVHMMKAATIAVESKRHKIGSVKVKIDGVEKANVSLNSSTYDFDYLVYREDGLTPGYHVVEVRPDTGWVVMSYLKVLPQPEKVSDEKSENTHVIVCHNSGLALDVRDDASGAGAHITQEKVSAGRKQQQWQVKPAQDGYYKIQNVGTGLYMTMSGDLKWVVQNPEDSSRIQQWQVIESESGGYYIINRGSNLCLSVFNRSTYAGSWLNTDTRRDDQNELWALRLIDAPNEQ